MLTYSVGFSKSKPNAHPIWEDPCMFFEEKKVEIFFYATASFSFYFQVRAVNH